MRFLVYKEKYHPQVRKDIKKLDKPLIKEILNKHLQIILENPITVCDQLVGDLSGIYSYHFKFNRIQYRIAYIINEVEQQIYILSISKRESFYQVLKRRIKSRI